MNVNVLKFKMNKGVGDKGLQKRGWDVWKRGKWGWLGNGAGDVRRSGLEVEFKELKNKAQPRPTRQQEFILHYFILHLGI